MSENRKYKGSLWIAIICVLVYGSLIGFVLGMVAYVYWPEVFFLGFLVSAGGVFFTRTTIELEDNRICIRGAGRKKFFEVSQFAYPSIRRKTHIGSYSKYTTVKCYLIFDTPEGYGRCRLQGFSERDLEKALDGIRNVQAKYLPDEEKTAIAKAYSDEASEALIQEREGKNEFLLPSSVLIKKEKEFLRKIFLVIFGLVLVVIVLDANEILMNRTFSVGLLYLTILVFALLVFVIVIYAGLGIKRGICAERLVIGGEYLKVGEEYYSYACIETICLTSPRKRGDSVFPVQRYMYISTGKKTKKYWLGSEVSFRSYESLCQSLEQGMILTPNKLRYK